MSRIDINGEIVRDKKIDLGNGDSYTAPGTVSTVKYQIATGQAPFEIHVNSCGGSTSEGIALCNLLRDTECEVFVDGNCWSAATFLLCAGKKVTMRPGSLLMFHPPETEAEGDAEDLKAAVVYLETIQNQAAQLYANRTGKTLADMLTLVTGEETWMDAQTAVTNGFADVAEGAVVEVTMLSKFGQGRKISANAPDSAKMAVDPIGYFAQMFGVEANPEKIKERHSVLLQAESDLVKERDALNLANESIQKKDADLATMKAAHESAVATHEAELRKAQDSVNKKVADIVTAAGLQNALNASKIEAAKVEPDEAEKIMTDAKMSAVEKSAALMRLAKKS